ncbi:hypothetical protein GWI33_000844 [Rhynchophorus ferrugineus]|uniref:Uncharacterized protein n=1 Tax=Rhynchophorus ferrugineus TaxID=354439 RepID=A0A834MGP6_RHYFE|nr:hypothetical protein GWI33_000844 [Rhynchophorus ferrugineus]
MNFFIYNILCAFFILLLCSEYAHQTQLVEVLSDALETRQSTISVAGSNTTINETTIKPVLRKKKKKRRKLKSTTVSPLSANSPVDNISGVSPTSTPVSSRRRRKKLKSPAILNTTQRQPDVVTTQKVIKRKLKKRRRRRRKKQRNNNSKVARPISSKISKDILFIQEDKKMRFEPGNLVKPMLPQPDHNNSSSRCGNLNGGCAHLCLPGDIQQCACFQGFKLGLDGKNCIDIDECLEKNGGCEAICINTVGSYKCSCPVGLRLSINLKSCEDINECRLRNGHGPCQDSCENTFGGYKCNCNRLRGTKLSTNLHTCVDIDECAIDNGGCSHTCINAFGKSFCSCPDGLQLSSDFKSCLDINECEMEEIQKSCPHGCLNLEGTYQCLEASDLQNDAAIAKTTCKPLYPPTLGYYKCSRKHAVQSYNPKGRKRVRNSVGTKCILVCPDGYKRAGKDFSIICGINGVWHGSFHAYCVLNEEVTETKTDDKQLLPN